MKLFVNGFSQEAVLSMVDTVKDSHGKDKTIRIDCTDLEILRWLVDFYPKMSKIKDGAHEYAFFTYKKVLEDLPILNISKQALSDRFKKMEHFGILRVLCKAYQHTCSFIFLLPEFPLSYGYPCPRIFSLACHLANSHP